jgi:hypothetical protein
LTTGGGQQLLTTPDRPHGKKLVLQASASLVQKWDAYLAGGAGLALQLGHRRSIDLDWFTRRTLPPPEILSDVQSLGLPLHVRQNDEGTFLGQVGGIESSVFRSATSSSAAKSSSKAAS